MTLNIIDVSKYQGPDPDYSGYDGVIVNITPQNVDRDAQVKKAHDEGKIILYYSWPLAYTLNWTNDAASCAAYVNSLISQYGDWARGPIFQDYESGSFTGDPIAGGLTWINEIHKHNLGAHDYVQYSLISQYNWAPHVQAGAALWFAEYTDNPDQTFGPWPFATGWQYKDTAGASGGDSSYFYCDPNAIHALSFPPGHAPTNGNAPAPAPAPVQAPAQPQPAPPIAGQAIVQAGDSLSSIANQVGVSLQAIEEVNRQIPNFDQINVGQVINLPAGANLGALNHPDNGRTYTVREGDTLGGIAAEFGTDYETLARINGIADPNYITVGEVIKLP